MRDALAQALPGFGGATAAAGATTVIALPTAAKVVAVAVLMTGGGVTVGDTIQRDGRPTTAASSPLGHRAPDDALRPRPSLTSTEKQRPARPRSLRQISLKRENEPEVEERPQPLAAVVRSSGAGAAFEHEDDDTDDTDDSGADDTLDD